ncbi:MAG: hypothetical protein ACOYJK_02455 [Prevotella sp.]
METANNNMTAERSLEIIAKTIEQSRHEVSSRSAKYLLLWGILVAITSLIVGHLWQRSGNPTWNYLWFAMTLVGVIAERLLAKREKTHTTGIIPTLIGNVWATFGFFAIGIILALLIAYSITPLPNNDIPLTGVFALLMGMATAMTGWILKKNILTFCGIFTGILGLILDLYIDGGYEMFIITGMAIVGLIIPGLYLMSKYAAPHSHNA